MVLNRQQRVRVATKPLAEFLVRVQEALRLSRCDVGVCLVSDAAMARLNRAFRGKRGPTDVLSFPTEGNGRKLRMRKSRSARLHAPSRFAVSPASSASYVGDIAIAPETARRNARRLARRLPQELRILILHGMLHLAGYDHETDRGEMERLERRLRRRFGLT